MHNYARWINKLHIAIYIAAMTTQTLGMAAYIIPQYKAVGAPLYSSHLHTSIVQFDIHNATHLCNHLSIAVTSCQPIIGSNIGYFN